MTAITGTHRRAATVALAGGCLSVMLLVVHSPAPASGQQLENGGFESGGMAYWSRDDSTAWRVVDLDMPGKQGSFYASTCASIWPGDGGCRHGGGEEAVGILRSHVFAISSRFLTYRVAGYSGQYCERGHNELRLRDADTHVILRSVQPCHNALKEGSWDLLGLAGQRAYVEAVDGDAAGSWAHISVDGFVLQDSVPPTVEPPALSLTPAAGEIIYTSTPDGYEGLYLIAADGTMQRRLPPTSVKAFHPCWSPDGGRYAFGTNQGVICWAWAASGQGGTVMTVSTWPTSPAWAPTGNALAYVANVGDGTDVYVADLATGDLLRMTHLGTASEPDWSPAGDRIAFASGGDLFAVDVHTRQVVPLSAEPVWEGFPAWSPDGRRLAASVDGELATIELETGERATLTHGFSFVTQSVWSPEGRYLAFSSDRDGDREIYVLEVQTGAVAQLTDNTWPDFYPDWRRDVPTAVLTTDAAAMAGPLPLLHLSPPYPNPFNSSMAIALELTAAAAVSVRVYDVLGQCVAALAAQQLGAGVHRLSWDGRDAAGAALPTGAYLVQARSSGCTSTRKAALIR